MGRIFCFHKSNSGRIATSRLKMMLISDQSGCAPGLIEGLREELVEVLSRYIEFDSGKIELCVTRTECAESKDMISAISAIIPIRRFTNMRKE
ncbi:MAG: cell division topological specificity factor MinE [Lachnospiraceae bacterium]|nr:cell division topological specificity factor MinE [Lachnospiraceae bacterium]